MNVKEAFQQDYATNFLGPEEDHLKRLEDAYVNIGTFGFQWYGEKGAPADLHSFSRKDLDRELARTKFAEERVLKVACDAINSKERAHAVRYLTSPLMTAVVARVRQDQIRLATATSRELLEKQGS